MVAHFGLELALTLLDINKRYTDGYRPHGDIIGLGGLNISGIQVFSTLQIRAIGRLIALFRMQLKVLILKIYTNHVIRSSTESSFHVGLVTGSR